MTRQNITERSMPPFGKQININAMARKIDVDNRIPLSNYYRIADNLLKQASIYRGEKNIIDLYVMLLRYSSLVMDTIKNHRDFHIQCPKERAFCKKQLRKVVDELESLKEKCYSKVDELNKSHTSQYYQPDAAEGIRYGSEASSFEWPPVNNKVNAGSNDKQVLSDTANIVKTAAESSFLNFKQELADAVRQFFGDSVNKDQLKEMLDHLTNVFSDSVDHTIVRFKIELMEEIRNFRPQPSQDLRSVLDSMQESLQEEIDILKGELNIKMNIMGDSLSAKINTLNDEINDRLENLKEGFNSRLNAKIQELDNSLRGSIAELEPNLQQAISVQTAAIQGEIHTFFNSLNSSFHSKIEELTKQTQGNSRAIGANNSRLEIAINSLRTVEAAQVRTVDEVRRMRRTLRAENSAFNPPHVPDHVVDGPSQH